MSLKYERIFTVENTNVFVLLIKIENDATQKCAVGILTQNDGPHDTYTRSTEWGTDDEAIAAYMRFKFSHIQALERMNHDENKNGNL